MEPIKTKENKEKAEAKKRKIISFGLLIIMVLSTAGYALIVYQGNSNGGQSGDNNSGQPQNNQNLNLVNSKEETKNVQTELSFRLTDYSGKSVYLDSDLPAASYEITSSIGKYSGKIQEACYGKCQKNLPEKNCTSFLIVVNSTSEKNAVRQSDNCVFIEGNLKAVDAFIYKVFEGAS